MKFKRFLLSTFIAVPALCVLAGLASFISHWQEELRLLGQQATRPGDGRFYYSGWAQAVLLDTLAPGWKQLAFEPGIYLEDLLREALP